MAIANITNNILTDSGVATSSLLTTSAASSTYVPYTGATANVTLGAFDLSADDVTLTSNLASLTRDVVNSIGILRLQKGANGYIQPSTLAVDRTYTLPDATGTIALTSNLSAYLPLSGGTLTGTLTLATTQYIGNLQFGTSQAASIGYDAGSGAMTYNITAGAAATSTYYNFLADGTSIVKILKGGNVGIGVTPNDWYTGNSSKALQIGVAGVAIWGYGSTTNINTYLTNNAYYDSVGWKYAQASGKASFYQQNNGIHFWATTDTVGAAAGNVLSLTERMRLSATGNLAIGTSSDNYRLEVNANAATWATRIYNASATGNGMVVVTQNTTTNALFALYNGTSYVLYARNDGEVLVGTTSNTINSSNFGIRLAPDGTFQNSRNTGGGGGVFFTYGNAGQMFVYGNGNVVNTNNSYGPVSDIKLKENIIDTTPKLDKLMQVRIVNYNLIQYPEQNLLGVIAQELEQVFPSLVDEHIDKDEEGNDLETTTKSVKMSVFVPILIKAMQEQQAQIEELKALINK